MTKRIFHAKYWQEKKHVGIFILRVFLGVRLLYGVIDNVLSWDRMIEFSDFLANHQFPIPLVSAVFSVYGQFIAGVMMLIGYKTRVAAFFLVLNFLVALMAVHIKAGDSIEGMTPALAMLFISFAILFTGADKLSFDHLIKSRQ